MYLPHESGGAGFHIRIWMGGPCATGGWGLFVSAFSLINGKSIK
jgi:hypothetical protein